MLIIHQSFSASNFNILLQYFGPEGPSSGNYTIHEHTIRLAMHRQLDGYFYTRKDSVLTQNAQVWRTYAERYVQMYGCQMLQLFV